MAEAENIALYRRLIEDGVGVGNLELLDEILSPEIVLPTLAPMAEPTVHGLKQLNEVFRAGIPDARAEIVEIIAVVAENIFTNLLNIVAATDIDFPVVHAADIAAAA